MILRPRTLAWLAGYFLVAVLPLLLGLIDLDPGRGFWINLSVAAGFVALAMLGMQFLLAARVRLVSDPVGMDVILRYHRQITYVALVLILGHPAILFITDSRFLPLLAFWDAPLRAQLALTSVVLVLVLVATSLWRGALRLGYARWQALHAILAVAVVVTALGHTVLVGYYVREPWESFLWLLSSLAFIGLGVWVRIVKPILRRHRRWIVEEVIPEAGGATTVRLRLAQPTSYGPEGFTFAAGQFSWILMRRSPFALTYHPFSMSSSAEHHQHVAFTIKAFGEFTREVARLSAGEVVYLDGPYGSFSLEESGGAPLLLIGGGVGVTPMASMLATLADRGDARPCVLLLANRDLESRTCGAQVDALRERLNLTVVDVLERPPADWSGPRGHLTRDLVRDHVTALGPDVRVFVCGPPGLMDAVDAILADLAVPADRVHAERFGMV